MLLLSTSSCGIKKNNYIINVSYDATREFYADYNDMFVKHWKDIKGEDIEVIQSHRLVVAQDGTILQPGLILKTRV